MTGDEIFLIVNNWLKSDERKRMLEGEQYYLTNNDILRRKFYYWNKKDKMPDTYRANVKIPANFFKTIVDQKISYVLGNDVKLENFETSFDINDEIYFVAETATQKSVGWNFIFVDEFGELKQKTMKSEDIIEIKENSIEEKTTEIIRIYWLDDIKYAEVWDSFNKTTYMEDKGTMILTGQETHLDNGESWCVIPFIKICNNRYQQSDLVPIKSLIDAYDLVISDFANNFIDFQEVIFLIKNYAENVKTEDAAIEIMEFLKKYKVINVKSDGSFEIVSQEIPYEARKEFLIILRKLIFLFSQAVDIDDLIGTDLTNINIKARFSQLDHKANKFIKELRKFIIEMLKFSNLFWKIKNQNNQISEISKAKITFNKSVLINESEKIHDCIDMIDTGVAANDTIVANNPIVEDVPKELEKIANEQMETKKNKNDDFGSLEDDDK